MRGSLKHKWELLQFEKVENIPHPGGVSRRLRWLPIEQYRSPRPAFYFQIYGNMPIQTHKTLTKSWAVWRSFLKKCFIIIFNPLTQWCKCISGWDSEAAPAWNKITSPLSSAVIFPLIRYPPNLVEMELKKNPRTHGQAAVARLLMLSCGWHAACCLLMFYFRMLF